MGDRLRREISNRARGRCEYCRLPEHCSVLSFDLEHVIAEKHGGETVLQNLAYACRYCNAYKGPNIAGIDPETGHVVTLFHPRQDRWEDHFRWNGPELVGQTAVGRATIQVLRMNHPEMVALRKSLLREGIRL